MNIAICDDEEIYVKKVMSHVKSAADKHGVSCGIYAVSRGTELLKLCEERKIDAVFLDISMPGINGFETADKLLKLRNDLILIFVSSQEAMVFSSYEYKPFWFVPKSQLKMLDIVANKMIKTVEENEKQSETMLLRVEDKRIVEINLENVMFIKACEHYVNIFEKNGEKSESYRTKLDDVELQLKDMGFLRVHNRYLVNLRKISVIEKNSCVLFDDTEIPVSRARMQQTKEAFQKHLRSRL